MRAELKRLHSPDVQDLESYVPQSPEDFGFLLQLMVGAKHEPGEESFDIVVCTPEWLKHQHKSSELVFGRHFLILFEYNYDRLKRFLEQYCDNCVGSNWAEVAARVGRIGKWEFEDYQEAGPRTF